MKNTVLDNFIVLEGLDGAGTTTQLKMIDHKLDQCSVPHFCAGEPTDGFIGRSIRLILEKKLEAQPRTIALLFAADRNEHLKHPEQGILARLDRGQLVICDRYLFSSLAYQSLACGFDFVLSLNQDFPLPRQLIFLDTPIPLSQQRLKPRGGKDLFDSADLQSDILSAYQKAFSLYKDTGLEIHRLDGSLPPEQVFDKIWNIIRTLPMLKA